MTEQPKWYEQRKWQKPVKEKDGWHCPKCGGRLGLRTNKRDMTSFLGCERYPWTCNYTSPATEQEMNAKERKEQAQYDAFMETFKRS